MRQRAFIDDVKKYVPVLCTPLLQYCPLATLSQSVSQEKLLLPRLFQEPRLPSPRTQTRPNPLRQDTAGITHIQTAADSHLKTERDETPVNKDLADSVTESLVEPHQRTPGDAEEENASVPLSSTMTRAL